MSESEHLSTHLYSIYSVITIQPLPKYEPCKFHFHCRNNLLDNYRVAMSCHFSYLKVAGKEKFPGVLSWTAQQRRRTWSGNSLLKAGRSLSCGEQSAKLVLHPLLLTGPISSGPCFFFLHWRKRKEKIAVVQWGREQPLNQLMAGIRCSGWQTPALLDCLPALWPCCGGCIVERAFQHWY